MRFWWGGSGHRPLYRGKQEGLCHQKLNDHGEVECGSL
jgi:hypothetical protein